jgi:hypothetical protein
VLDFVVRVRTPVHRESLLKDLAGRLAFPIESLREQYRARVESPRSLESTPRSSSRPASLAVTEGLEAVDPREKIAWTGIVAALLADASLIPLARPRLGRCVDPELARILEAILHLYGEEDSDIDAASVMNRLADHPARDRVVPLLGWARVGESPRILLEEKLCTLYECDLEKERALLEREMKEVERSALLAGGVAAAASSPRALELARALNENRRLAGALRHG